MDHGPTVLAALATLAVHRADLVEAAKAVVETGGGKLYRSDFFVIGAVKRTVSLAAGFELLVRAYNIVCARALVRMQLDTTLRFAALSLVSDQDAFVDAVLGDQRIDKLKDRDGHFLRDAYLVERFKPIAPWLPEVYRRTSGYIHLSGEHIFSSIHAMNDETRTVTMVVATEDRRFPDWSWVEMIECFDRAVVMLVGQLQAWNEIKKTLQSGHPGGHSAV
jgi:hypothetical protein